MVFARKTSALALGIFLSALLTDRVLLASFEMGGVRTGDLPLAPAMRIVAAALLATAVAWPASLSRLRGARLTTALFLAVWGIGTFLPWIEGAVFLDLSPRELAVMAGHGTLFSGVIAGLAGFLFNSVEKPGGGVGRRRSLFGQVWRIALCAVIYVVLYFAAGIAVYPFVRSYYETTGQVPNPELLPVLQLVRGALYVVVLLPLVRGLAAGRLESAFATALFVPVFAGVAALLLPNPILPDDIRPFHLVEIGVSNFVYGWLIGWLFWSGADPGPGPSS